MEVLGEGSFGVVVLARDLRRNEPVAVKLIPRGPQLTDFSRYVKREIIHQSTLRSVPASPHVLPPPPGVSSSSSSMVWLAASNVFGPSK